MSGLGAVKVGFSNGPEWLGIPWHTDLLFVAGGALVGISLVLTLLLRVVLVSSATFSWPIPRGSAAARSRRR
jgi:cbb3-type cytochrome oxidase subunit 1